MANVLDELIAKQEADWKQGIRPAASTLGTGQAAVAPAVTVAPNSGIRTADDSFFFQKTMWEQNLNPAQVRQDLKLDDLKTIAAARRFELERAQKRAPLEDRLLEAQINASGSHDRFTREQDAQTLQHMSGFLTDLSRPDAPGPNDPNYRSHVFNSLLRNPRFAETPGGIDLLKKLSDTRQTHATIEDITKSLAGKFDVAGVTMGPQGPSYNLKPVDPDTKLEAEAKGYGIPLSMIRNPIGARVGRIEAGGFVGDETGDIVQIEGPEGKTIKMTTKEYERFGGTFSKEGAAKRSEGANVKHLGKYNPQTGKFDK